MATPNFLTSLPPDVLGRVLRSSNLGGDEQMLQQRLQRARALQQQGAPRYSSPWAAALGGLAGVVNAGRGAYEEKQALEGLEGLGQKRQDGRQALLDAYTGGMRQQQVTAPDVIAPNIGIPDATPEQQAMAAALRSQQQEDAAEGVRQGVGQLGLLSGDPTLRDFSKALLKTDTGDLQEARLAQSAERLRLMTKNAQSRNDYSERRLAFLEEQAALRKETAETKAAEKKVADALKLEGDLRKEVMGNDIAKDFLKAQVAYDKVVNAAKLGTGAGDVALVFNLMKTLDPGSTVNSGEQASASNTTNVPGQLINTYNRLLTGEKLNPEQRQDFIRAAGTALAAQQAGFRRFVEGYRGIAQRAGADLADVLPIGAGTASIEPSLGAAPVRATPAGGNIDLNAPAAPAVTTQEMRDAEAWLKGNPSHADAPAVRARLEALRAGGVR